MEHLVTSFNIEEAPSGNMMIAEGEAVTDQYQSYLADESKMQVDSVEKIFFPKNERDIADAVSETKKAGKSLSIAGARTGITGASVPESDYLISLDGLTAVKRIDKKGEDYIITIDPGLSLDDFAAMVQNKSFDPSISGADEFNGEKGSFLYPVDPTERTASLGGTCATNASGARTYFFGPTRDYVEGLRVILDNGEQIRLMRGDCSFDDSGKLIIQGSDGSSREVQLPSYSVPDLKHAAGYYARKNMDLVDLFIGSEGTLGVISELSLKVISFDKEIFSAVAFLTSNDEAVSFALAARSSDAVTPLALEFFDSNALQILRDKKTMEGDSSKIKEIPDYAKAAVYFEEVYETEDEMFEKFEIWDELLQQNGSSMENTWGGMDEGEKETLKHFRHEVPEGINNIVARRKQKDSRIHKVGTDMSVPDDRLKEIYDFYTSKCDEAGLQYVIFGHIGDNHLHVNILPESYDTVRKAKELYSEFAEKVVAMGGSVAAEHGIGKIKKMFLPIMFGEEGVEEMKKVKQAFDPDGIFSPGNLF